MEHIHREKRERTRPACGVSFSAVYMAVVMLCRSSASYAQSATPVSHDSGLGQQPSAVDGQQLVAVDSARRLDAAAAGYARRGQYAIALDLWQRAARLAPDDVAAHFDAGIVYEMTYRAADALREFRMAYRLKPEPQMLYHLGVSYHNVGMRDSALASFQAALAANPTDTPSLGYAALTKSEMGRDSEAVADWRRALQIQPKYFELVEPQLRQVYEHSLQVVMARQGSSARH